MPAYLPEEYMPSDIELERIRRRQQQDDLHAKVKAVEAARNGAGPGPGVLPEKYTPSDPPGVSGSTMPVTPVKSDWFHAHRCNSLYIVAVRLRLDAHPTMEGGISNYKHLFPFDDIHIQVGDTKAFFTYYKNNTCVTIEDDANMFPSDEFLAVLRVAMDGCK